MGDLLQPVHIVVLLIFVGVVVFVVRGNRRSSQPTGSSQLPQQPQALIGPRANLDPTLPELKYCSECGQQIKRRAEICPLCGCRQAGR